MKIAVTKTRSKRRKDFDRSEWRSVNIDNFGKENDWSTK